MLLPCLLAGAAQAAPLTVSVADASGRPLAGAVVAVEIGGAARTAAAGTRAEVVQRQRNFDPGVLVVQTGTQVDFPARVKLLVASVKRPSTAYRCVPSRRGSSPCVPG